MKLNKKYLKRIVWIIFIIPFFVIIYFFLSKYLNYEYLKLHHAQLTAWKNQHYIAVLLSYMVIYIIVIALCIPELVLITMIGGFLFGPIAILYVLISITIGEIILFLVARNLGRDYFTKKAGKRLIWVEKHFQKNSVLSLIILKMLPFFPPLWVIDITAAILGVTFRDFVIATFIGIIPTITIYVFAGYSLSSLLK